MLSELSADPVKQSSGMQTKTADHLHDRKTAASALSGRLRVNGLIFRGVGQSDSCAVNHPDRSAMPFPGSSTLLLQVVPYLLEALSESTNGKPSPSLDVG